MLRNARTAARMALRSKTPKKESTKYLRLPFLDGFRTHTMDSKVYQPEEKKHYIKNNKNLYYNSVHVIHM